METNDNDEDVVKQDLPAAVSLMHELKSHIQNAVQPIERFATKLNDDELDTSAGISFLDLKYQLLLKYLINLTYLLLKKCSGEQVEGESCVSRLVEIRTVLERIRPIDQKLKYQIDKLMRLNASGETKADDPLNFKPNLANFDSSRNADVESENESDTEKPKSGVYVPPKLAAMHYNEEGPSQAAEETRRRRKLGSSLMQDFREEYLDTPVEVYEGGDARRQQLMRKEKDRQEYEETYFTRLAVTKKERHQRRQVTTIGTAGDDITYFGDISSLADGDDGPREGPSKKRKKSFGAGKTKGGKFKKKRKSGGKYH